MNIIKFTRQINTNYPAKIELNYIDNSLVLSKIIVKPRARNKGIGTKIINELLNFAKSERVPLKLLPSSIFGSNFDRLVNFYAGFGFKFINDEEIMIYETN